VNQRSWTNLSSVLWVEQPVGTGFSQGIPNAQNEDDVAVQVIGFMQQFLEVFSELKGKKLYLSGESVRFSQRFKHRANCIQYAGSYVPCEPAVIFFELTSKTNADIANYIHENPTQLDLSLQGMWINDRNCPFDLLCRALICEAQPYSRGMWCNSRSLQWTS
jgi:carboxypeptidase D